MIKLKILQFSVGYRIHANNILLTKLPLIYIMSLMEPYINPRINKIPGIPSSCGFIIHQSSSRVAMLIASPSLK